MNENGWKVFEKKITRVGYLEKYTGRIVIIVSRGKGKQIYLTDSVYEALGKPTHVEIMTRGSNAAIMGSKDEFAGYKVGTSKTSLRHVNCKSFIQEFGLKPGTYEAHIETGKVVFDMEQHPGK